MSKSKEKYEEDIKEIVETLLPKAEMRKIKEERRKEIEKQIKSANAKTKKRLEKELKHLEYEKRIEELVKANYSEDFLVDINNINKSEKKVLAMGINPGGGDKIKKHTRHQLLFVNKDEEGVLDVFKGYEVFQNYYGKNYEIFDKIDGKAHWAIEKYLPKKEIEELIESVDKQRKEDGKKAITKKERENIIVTIQNMQEEEIKRKGPYVIFAELLWYADGKQSNIEKVLNRKKKEENKVQEEKPTKKDKEEKSFNDNIRDILKLNIDYYKPELIVVTNAYASNLINDALNENDRDVQKNVEKYKSTDVIKYHNVPIIFSGMVSGQRTMDNFSFERLQDRVYDVYNKKL